MEIFYTPKFAKTFKKIPTKIQLLAVKKEKIFLANLHDPRLNTHALTGEMSGNWSFSVNYQYRVVFCFIENNNVLFIVIGTHEVYK